MDQAATLPADLVVRGAGELATVSSAAVGGGASSAPPGPRRPFAGQAQGEAGLVRGGAVAAFRGRIVAAGPEAEVLAAVEPTPDATVVDAEGRLVTPGLVDCHTHLCFAGWRAEEFRMRIEGRDYLEILKAGGGILQTVRATREATEDELFDSLRARLLELLRLGTTTVEVKSGYGLDLATELKQLRAIRRAALWAASPEGTGQEVVATFLGAHAVPPEFAGRAREYAELVAREMIPAVARESLAEFVDVFCEDGAFGPEEARLVLEAGRRAGLGRKIHADEVHHLGGARIAAELGAVSADHLAVTPPGDFAALRDSGTVACLLPATSFFLMKPRHAAARELIAAGVPVALGTDANPGTQPGFSLPLVMSLACLLLRMTPEEALVAATRNAAFALGRGGRAGSLEPGARADIVIWDCPALAHLPYRMGANLAHTVIAAGRVRVSRAGRDAETSPREARTFPRAAVPGLSQAVAPPASPPRSGPPASRPRSGPGDREGDRR